MVEIVDTMVSRVGSHLDSHATCNSGKLKMAASRQNFPYGCICVHFLFHSQKFMMKQTSNPNNVYPISQNAKLVLLERLKQEITSKIVDVAKKRKRKRASASIGGGDEKIITSDASTDDGTLDATPPSKSIAQSIVRSRLIVGE